MNDWKQDGGFASWDEALARVRELEGFVRRVAEYDGEWVEDDPLIIRDEARRVLA